MLDQIKRLYNRFFGSDKEYYAIFHDMLGITPDNIELYKLALIHKSASIRLSDGSSINNERLEFLGDAVLEAIVSDFLFIEFPSHPEGFLTQMRSRIVSRSSLNEIAKELGLDRHLISNPSGTFIQKHLYGNALEALIGAIYLDKGYDCINRVMINDILKKYIDLGEVSHTENDFKSRLIELCQKSKSTIEFKTSTIAESTTHQPQFISHVLINGEEIGHGIGSSKKEAEQHASYTAWQLTSDEVGDYILDTLDTLKQEA